jgi:hypothetical protein
MERVPRPIHLMLHQARASLQIKVNISQLGKRYFREIGTEKISFLVFWDATPALLGAEKNLFEVEAVGKVGLGGASTDDHDLDCRIIAE